MEISLATIAIAASLCTLGPIVYKRYSSQTEHIFNNQFLENKSLNSESAVIVLDMHKVFIEQNFPRIFFHMLCRYYTQLLPLLFYPTTYKNGAMIKRETKVGEQICERIEQLYPQFQGLKQALQEEFVAEPAMPATIELIKKLKTKGYRIYVLTNCAHDTYLMLSAKYPEIFNLFDGYYTPSRENNFACKPQPEFYRLCQEYLAQQGVHNKTILFSDDKMRNIYPVLKPEFNWTCIQFTSATQLARDIEKLEKTPQETKQKIT